jgi:hypothetical protein
MTNANPRIPKASTPWKQLVREQEIYECSNCQALISGLSNRYYGRLPNKVDAALCECCEPNPKPTEG